MPHSVKTYRKRAEAQRHQAIKSSNDGSGTNHLELAEIYRARADLIDALSVPDQPSSGEDRAPEQQ